MENPPPLSPGFPKRPSELPDRTSLRSLVDRVAKADPKGHYRDVLIKDCCDFETKFFGGCVQGPEADVRKVLVFVAKDRLARLRRAYDELHTSQGEGPSARLLSKWKEVKLTFHDYERGMRWIRKSEEKEAQLGPADLAGVTDAEQLFSVCDLFATLRAEIEGPWSLPLFNQYGQFYSGFYLLSPLDQTFFPTQTVTTLARLGHGWATYQKWRDMLALEATPGHDGHDLSKLIAAYKVQLEKADSATKAVFANAHIEHRWIDALHGTPYGDLQDLLHSLIGPVGEPQQTAWRTFVDCTNQLNLSKRSAFCTLPKVQDEIHLLKTFFSRYQNACKSLPGVMSDLFHNLYHGMDGQGTILPLLQPYIECFAPFGLAEEVDQHCFGEITARLSRPGHPFRIANPACLALRALDKFYFAARNDAATPSAEPHWNWTAEYNYAKHNDVLIKAHLHIMESLRLTLKHDCLKALAFSVEPKIPMGQGRWCYAMLSLLAWVQCFPLDVEAFITGPAHPRPDFGQFQILARMHTWSFVWPNVLYNLDQIEWPKVRSRFSTIASLIGDAYS
jgi:hypothetical protein